MSRMLFVNPTIKSPLLNKLLEKTTEKTGASLNDALTLEKNVLDVFLNEAFQCDVKSNIADLKHFLQQYSSLTSINCMKIIYDKIVKDASFSQRFIRTNEDLIEVSKILFPFSAVPIAKLDKPTFYQDFVEAFWKNIDKNHPYLQQLTVDHLKTFVKQHPSLEMSALRIIPKIDHPFRITNDSQDNFWYKDSGNTVRTDKKAMWEMFNENTLNFSMKEFPLENSSLKDLYDYLAMRRQQYANFSMRLCPILYTESFSSDSHNESLKNGKKIVVEVRKDGYKNIYFIKKDNKKDICSLSISPENLHDDYCKFYYDYDYGDETLNYFIYHLVSKNQGRIERLNDDFGVNRDSEFDDHIYRTILQDSGQFKDFFPILLEKIKKKSSMEKWTKEKFIMEHNSSVNVGGREKDIFEYYVASQYEFGSLTDEERANFEEEALAQDFTYEEVMSEAEKLVFRKINISSADVRVKIISYQGVEYSRIYYSHLKKNDKKRIVIVHAPKESIKIILKRASILYDQLKVSQSDNESMCLISDIIWHLAHACPCRRGSAAILEALCCYLLKSKQINKQFKHKLNLDLAAIFEDTPESFRKVFFDSLISSTKQDDVPHELCSNKNHAVKG